MILCKCRDQCGPACVCVRVCAQHNQPCVPACVCNGNSNDADDDKHCICRNMYSALPVEIISDDSDAD